MPEEEEVIPEDVRKALEKLTERIDSNRATIEALFKNKDDSETAVQVVQCLFEEVQLFLEASKLRPCEHLKCFHAAAVLASKQMARTCIEIQTISMVEFIVAAGGAKRQKPQ
jgi:hypothetical protein